METKEKKVPHGCRLAVLLFVLVFLSVWIVFRGEREHVNFFENIRFCENFEEITAGKQPVEMDFEDVLFYNGQAVPYTIPDNRFYISQDTQTDEWEGELQPGDGYEIYFLADDMWNYKKATIASGHPLLLLIVKGESYRTASLVVTGLPILSMTENGADGAQLLSLMAAEAEDSCEEPCSYEVPGWAGDISAKCGYEITLRRETGNSTWMLHPLCGSLDKVFKKMACRVWEEIQEYNDTEMNLSPIAYVEVIINHQYQGIYGMQQQEEENAKALGEPGEDGTPESMIDYEFYWRRYRQSIFSEDHLKALAQECMDELTFSGALAREAIRWPEAENSSDLTEIYRIIEQRLAFFDQYYGES